MVREKAIERLKRITEMEREFWAKGIYPCGMDEVGRGPLAGPVVAACVVMPSDPLIADVNDSKKIAEKKRTELAKDIRSIALDIGIGRVEPAEIDEMNILVCTRKAFEQAFFSLTSFPEIALTDSISGLNLNAEVRSYVRGDSISYLIACASIIAKDYRDALMIKYDKDYPQYGFAKNKGYGTAQHIEAIRKHGLCELHRMTFVKNFL